MPLIKRIIFAVLLGMLVASIALGLLFWRIQSTPTSLSLIEPIIKSRISNAIPNVELRFDSLHVFLDRDESVIKLRLTNVVVDGEEGFVDKARVSDLELHLSSQAFIDGDIAVLSVLGGDVQIDLFASVGAAHDASFDYAQQRNHAASAIRQIFKSTAFAQLSDIALTDVKVTSPDIATSLAFNSIGFEKTENGINALLDGVILGRTAQASLSADLFVPENEGTAKILSQLQSDDIAALAADIAGEQWRGIYDGGMNATSTFELGQNPDEDVFEFSAELGPGRFSSAQFYEGERAVKALNLSARYQPTAEILTLEELKLEFDALLLTVNGVAQGPFDRPALQIEGRMDGLDAQSMQHYWPLGLAQGGLAWIKENIEQGQLPNGQIRFAVTPEMWEGELPANALQFSFDIEDLTAHYNRPMPPLTRAYGQGLLSLDDLILTIDEGELAGLKVTKSQIKISPFSKHPQYADVDLKFNGPISNILHVLDSEPLGYISEFGLDPDSVSGRADAKLLLNIPLLSDLKIEEVEFEGQVQGSEIVLSDILGESDLENGRASFEVNGEGLQTTGTIEFKAIEVAIDWFEDFRADVENPTKAKLAFSLTDSQLRNLGFDAGNRFIGQITTAIEIEGRGAEIAKGRWTSDLSKAALYEPVLNWEKPLGTAAHFTSDLRVMNGKASFLDAELKGAGLTAKFDFSANDEGIILSADTVKYGANDFSFVTQREGESWAMDIRGASLDVAPVLETLYEPSDENAEAETTPWPDIRSEVHLDRLLMANETYLETTRAVLTVKDDHITQLSLSGLLNGSADFDLSLSETTEDTRQLTLNSSDAGLAAKGLDLFTEGSGGRLNVNAEIRGRQDEIEIDGLGEMQDFRLTKAPVLARILSTASLTGIADLARDGRINFRNAEVPFTLREGVFDIDNASANGPAIGLTLNGQFVQSLKQANLNGVIVPAYGFNSILNKVPLIGNILTGGENQGIFAINYSITGPLTDPELSVNPASMLAPGILRRIFSGRKPKVVVPELEESAPAVTPSQ